jgi:hypothetical protein
VQALVVGLLLRQDKPEQLALDLELGRARDTLHREWDSAADRESKALTKYAWSGIDLDEVDREVSAVRDSLGDVADIRAFVRDSLTGLGGAVQTGRDGLTVQTAALSAGLRHQLGLPTNGTTPDIMIHNQLPVPPGQHALVRTDPLVAALSRHVLDLTLDPHADSPATRLGLTRTRQVASRTVLLLVRYRLHVTLPGRDELRTLLAEDARAVAYRISADGDREWLDDTETHALLTASPDANALPELVHRTLHRVLTEVEQLGADLDQRAGDLAAGLLASHRRVRGATGARRSGLRVEPAGRPDVLGVYVYLPVGDTQ